MSDNLSAQHPPALRVGGRRLSVSARPKPHNAPNGAHTATNPRPAENADYPRPAAQGEGEEQAQAQTQTHPPPRNEEDAPKKEKKHGHGHDKSRLKESMYHKLDATTPSKDHSGSKHSFGAVGRISQPMGKALAV